MTSYQKKSWELRTKSGIPLPLVRSGLQKLIRYQREEEAGWFLAELHESGYTQYALNTLGLICVEDCAGDPQLVTAVMSVLSFWKDVYREKKARADYGPALGLVVLWLCRTKRQSRYGDDFWCWIVERRRAGWTVPVGEFAADEHVPEQYRLPHQQRRSWRFWTRVASVLKSPASAADLGGPSYSDVMARLWLCGKPGHEDEPDYEPLDLDDPYAPIIEKPFAKEGDGDSE